MVRKKIIMVMVSLSFLSVLILALFNSVFISPTLSRFLEFHFEKKLIEIASQMSSVIEVDEKITPGTVFSENFIHEIDNAKRVLGLKKVKIFSNTGTIVFSTDSRDIGQTTRKDFFDQLIVEKQVFSKIDISPAGSVDGQKHDVFLLETYVPITRGKETIGAFEIYYDITDLKVSLEQVAARLNFLVVGVALLLMVFVLISAFYASQSLRQQQLAEEEKDKLIEKLKTALGEIKSLQGILPLCSYCKNIRNDKGYWEKVDVYLQLYSSANISHSICPECVKKYYPDEFEEIMGIGKKSL